MSFKICFGFFEINMMISYIYDYWIDFAMGDLHLHIGTQRMKQIIIPSPMMSMSIELGRSRNIIRIVGVKQLNALSLSQYIK